MTKKLKQYAKSKTIWFANVGVPSILSFLMWAQNNLPLVKDNLGAAYGVTTFIIGGSVFWLRSVTDKSLSEKK